MVEGGTRGGGLLIVTHDLYVNQGNWPRLNSGSLVVLIS